jgi:alanine dehydrogenase
VKIYTIDEMRSVLKMPQVIESLRTLYQELGEGKAVNRGRTDIYSENKIGDAYILKSMDGVIPKLGVGAVRINSDIIRWSEKNGTRRKDKLPLAPGQRWTGLILAFSTETGEPLAIMPDGYIQRMRVGGTTAIALDLMARKDVGVLAVFGSGFQAGAQLLGACAVREFRELRVYSPNRHNLEKFRDEMRLELGKEIILADSPESLVRDADVVLCATNSTDPVVHAPFVTSGMHLSCVRNAEFDDAVYDLPMRIISHSHEAMPEDIVSSSAPDLDELKHNQNWYAAHANVNWQGLPTLADVVAGRAVPRDRDDEITCFFNPVGMGGQFAAVAAKLLELTRGSAVGRDLPTEWFTQEVHP